MTDFSLFAISPLDGRYSHHVDELKAFFSEFALIRYRVLVEIEYFIQFCDLGLPGFRILSDKEKAELRSWYESFSESDAKAVKVIEQGINHDVKAVEYFIKNKLKATSLVHLKEYIHFGLTSQDVNNTAIPLLMKEAWIKVLKPRIQALEESIRTFGIAWVDEPMLARTHGQPASPVRFGKEFLVFADRLAGQLDLLDQIPFRAKFGGATGGFNAHLVAYPEVDWVQFGNRFIQSLGLERTQQTTQIEPYDHLAAFMDGLGRVNTILIDFCRDVWQYISMDYLKQKVKEGEVGSSAMPHKVNPIDFENAEGNLGIANAIARHFSEKLPISRLQRDLTDSTVLRNLGLPFGHSLMAYLSIQKGLNKIQVNVAALQSDLEAHPEVLAEAIQTILRRAQYPEPYEALKQLTRTGEGFSIEALKAFVSSLPVSPLVKEELLRIKPQTYIGVRPSV